MTKHTDLSAPDNQRKNVLPFPSASDVPNPEEPATHGGHAPDGIPDGFLLFEDGI